MRLAGPGDGGRREGATISAGRRLNRPGLPRRNQGRRPLAENAGPPFLRYNLRPV